MSSRYRVTCFVSVDVEVVADNPDSAIDLGVDKVKGILGPESAEVQWGWQDTIVAWLREAANPLCAKAPGAVTRQSSATSLTTATERTTT